MKAATGEVLWTERPKQEGDVFFSSPVVVNGKLYNVSRKGEVVVFDPTARKEVGRMPLGEVCQSTPAVAAGRMYIRTYTHLICVGK
jgi:outer membrane protein assembly factor BamB